MAFNSRALVVSIHDISPMTWKNTARILSELEQLGVNSCSLLVIPNHHHHGHFLEDKEFCSWLSDAAKAGHEIVIHGYFHKRQRKNSEGIIQKFMTRIYTNDEGEFYDITEADALQGVLRAQADFLKINLNTSGFIAPAWLCSKEAEQALRIANCEYTVRLSGVWDLKNGVISKSQSIVYSVRSRWRRTISLLWNAFLFRRLKENQLLRISIHPPDFQYLKIWQQIRTYVSLALEDRKSITYIKWIENKRLAHFVHV